MRKLGKTVPLPHKMLNHFPLSEPSDKYRSIIVLSINISLLSRYQKVKGRVYVLLSITNMEEEKTKNKKFKSFPVRALRASDKTWNMFKGKRQKSGLSWNKFLLELSK